MSGFSDTPFPMLADGFGELVWILFIFGLYAAGAITKMLSKRKGEGDTGESAKSSYVVELAKKRAHQRQERARLQHAKQAPARKPESLSEWDRMQEAKRLRREQLRQQSQQVPKSVPPRPGVYQRPRPRPQPARQPKPARKMTDLVQEALTAMIAPQVQPRPRTVQKPQPKHQPSPQSAKTVAKTTKPSKRLAPAEPKAARPNLLQSLLSDSNNLRTAIVLKEILDKPIALREEW